MEIMTFSMRRIGRRGQRSALSLPLFVNDIIPICFYFIVRKRDLKKVLASAGGL
jgi:hypothetical protein